MNKIQKIKEKLRLSDNFLNEFYEKSTLIELKRNDYLVREKRVCQHIGIVKSGALYSFVTTEKNEIVNDLYSENSFITYYRSFLTQLPCSGNIKAIDDTTIHAFTFSQYQNLLKLQEWTLFFKYISDQLFIKKCARENGFMKHSAIERFKNLKKVFSHVEQDFPQYIIASYLGIKPETLSRIKSLDLHQEK